LVGANLNYSSILDFLLKKRREEHPLEDLWLNFAAGECGKMIVTTD